MGPSTPAHQDKVSVIELDPITSEEEHNDASTPLRQMNVVSDDEGDDGLLMEEYEEDTEI